MSSRTKLWLGITLGVTIILVVVFFLFFYKARLTVLPNPGDAEVLLDDHLVEAGTPLKLAPGTYSVVVRTDGYLATRQDLKLSISQNLDLRVTLREVPSPRPMANSVAYPILAKDQKAINYLGKDGRQFERIATTQASDGSYPIKAISGDDLEDLTEVIWSPNQQLALLRQANGAVRIFDFQRYNLVDQEIKELPADQRVIAWHPTEPIVVSFIVAPSGERSLFRRNVETGAQERLADLREERLTSPQLTFSPNGRKIMLVQDAVYLFDVQTRAVQRLAGTDGVRAATWSPKSDRILLEFADSLAVITPGKTEGGRLDVRASITKSIWLDNQSILVATPTDEGQDRIRKIDVLTNATTDYQYTSSKTVSMENIVVDSGHKQLWFTSQGTLYSLILEKAELAK